MNNLTKEQKDLENEKVLSSKRKKVKGLPKEIKNPKTGKVYKRGKDYSAESVMDEICQHETLQKLDHSYYICKDCKVIFQIPLSLQYSHSQLMEYWNNILKKLNNHFPKSNEQSENLEQKP